MRSLIAILFVIFYLIVSIPILGVMRIIRHFNTSAAEGAMFRIIRWAMGVVAVISGADITTIGRDNIPDDEAVLFVGNHQSIFDVVISYSQMKNPTGYIAKISLEKIPLLSTNMKFMRCLFIDRDDLKQGLETIHKAIDSIKDGYSIFIFPEGTRNKRKDKTVLGEFHRGSFKAAQRTGCRIVPVAFTNTAGIFENQFPWLVRRHVIVEYGEPIAYTDLTKEEQRHIDEYFRDEITLMVKKNEFLI